MEFFFPPFLHFWRSLVYFTAMLPSGWDSPWPVTFLAYATHFPGGLNVQRPRRHRLVLLQHIVFNTPHLSGAAAAADVLVGFLYSKHSKHSVAQSDDTVQPSLCSCVGSIKPTVAPGSSPRCKLSLQQAATETGGGDKRTCNVKAGFIKPSNLSLSSKH